MKVLIALVVGLLFGAGLSLGGMTRPQVVLGFLDVFGAWNPQLLFLMVGAVVTTLAGYRWVLGRSRPLFASRFQLPTARAIDRRLLGGAAVFGVGWGLAGYCPGPALASLGAGTPSLLLFVACMCAGWWFVARLTAVRGPVGSPVASPVDDH